VQGDVRDSLTRWHPVEREVEKSSKTPDCHRDFSSRGLRNVS